MLSRHSLCHCVRCVLLSTTCGLSHHKATLNLERTIVLTASGLRHSDLKFGLLSCVYESHE